MKYMVGVDVGGTFTDFTLSNVQNGQVLNYKVRSTPADPSLAIMQGIKEMLAQFGVAYSEVDFLVHGTTVATNALIERKGAKTALVVTEGFRDLLEIRDQTRPSLYNLQMEKPEPLVPVSLRVEARERCLQDGNVFIPLDELDLRAKLDLLKREQVDSIAICFLFSFVNSGHEKRAAELVREMFPQAYVTASNEVVAEFREYPRMSTTVLNAYLGPVMKRYLTNFLNTVKEVGIPVDPYITQSNGGTLSIHETIKNPVRTAISGPSGGVMAAVRLGELTGFRNMITFDMGGTSADISLIENGMPLTSVERKIDGWPARFPMLDIITIGAGGGSLAWVDAGGALKMGPQSAGADPGPACYMNGGTRPTVTDANIVMQRINPERILGGKMQVSRPLAVQAIEEHVCKRTGLALMDAANGMIDVVNANMVRAIRVVSVERGYDPQDFTLVAFGGAGPLHAVDLARELGIPRVMVPPSAGTLCSLGLLQTDIRTDHVCSRLINPTKVAPDEVRNIFIELKAQGMAVLEKENVAEHDRKYLMWVEARYRRQNYELMIPVEEVDFSREGLKDVCARFHAEHKKTYGYARPAAEVEFVNFRLAAVGELPKAVISQQTSRVEAGDVATLSPRSFRPVYFKSQNDFVNCAIYNRQDFYAGDAFSGPAIVEQMDATTVIPPNVQCLVDEYGNLILTM